MICMRRNKCSHLES